MRIQNYPFCMNKDPSEYYVDKVTENNQKACFERQSQVENTTKAPEQVLQSNRKKKPWPCNKKRKNDMKLRYFNFLKLKIYEMSKTLLGLLFIQSRRNFQHLLITT